jgi:PAS domain S-box-containing protein
LIEDATITPVLDETGQITHFIAVKQNITARKRAEEALKESQLRYQSLFENMLNGYAYCRLLFDQGRADFTYLEVNSAFETQTGLRNVVGKRVSDLIPGIQETNPEISETCGRVALTGKPERFETHLKPLGIWLSVAVYSHKAEHFVAIIEDILERKQAEEAMRARVQLQDQLVHTAATVPGMVFSFKMRPDGSFCLPYASGALENLFGLQPGDVLDDATPLAVICWPTFRGFNPYPGWFSIRANSMTGWVFLSTMSKGRRSRWNPASSRF